MPCLPASLTPTISEHSRFDGVPEFVVAGLKYACRAWRMAFDEDDRVTAESISQTSASFLLENKRHWHLNEDALASLVVW